MGPGTLSKKDVQGSRKQLDRHLAQVPEIEPVSTAIFGGVVDPTQLSFPFSHMPASDTRDWGSIGAWAEEVADAFGVASLPRRVRPRIPQLVRDR